MQQTPASAQYEAPRIEVIGPLSALTLGALSGNASDGAFVKVS